MTLQAPLALRPLPKEAPPSQGHILAPSPITRSAWPWGGGGAPLRCPGVSGECARGTQARRAGGCNCGGGHAALGPRAGATAPWVWACGIPLGLAKGRMGQESPQLTCPPPSGVGVQTAQGEHACPLRPPTPLYTFRKSKNLGLQVLDNTSAERCRLRAGPRSRGCPAYLSPSPQ